MGHMAHIWEKKYTPLNTEHTGKGRDAMGEGKAGTLRGGWAEPPASPEGGTASRSHLKKKIIQPKGRRWRAKCPIYTQHCKHTQSILHVLQSGVCMSVSQSRGRISGALSHYSPSLPSCPTLETAKRCMVPKFRRSTQEGLLHSGSRVLYVCLGVYVHVCTPGTCVQLYTKGKGFTVTEAGAGGVARGKACQDG